MSGIGYKPRGVDGPMYNPERDYAYITPTLMRFAVEAMAAPGSEELIRWKTEHEITEAEIERAASALAKAQRDFVNANDPVATFEHALRRHEFYSERLCVRQLLFSSIGEIFCAAWFKAVREVSIVGEESPAQVDMARFVAAVREFAVSSAIPTYNHDFRAELLQFQNDVLQTRVNELGQQLQKLSAELAAARASIPPVAEVAPKAKGWRRIFSSRSDHA